LKPQPRRFLFTHWEGGGNTPPMLALAQAQDVVSER
jgi:hypothetical protein